MLTVQLSAFLGPLAFNRCNYHYQHYQALDVVAVISICIQLDEQKMIAVVFIVGSQFLSNVNADHSDVWWLRPRGRRYQFQQ
jgi:hypothetical protein